MTNDAELGLRDRLAKLSGVKLLRGTRLSAELERLQRQLERLKDDTSDEEIWQRVELARHQEPAVHARLRRADPRRLLRAARRPRPNGRPRDRGRDRQARRTNDRAARPPEGARPEGANDAELRDGLSRGVPQGDARDGARRPAPVPAADARRHARRLSGRRGRAARAGRCDRALAGSDGPALRPHDLGRDRRGGLGWRDRDRGRRPGADAGERRSTRSSRPRAAPRSSGATRRRRRRPRPRSGSTPPTASTSGSSRGSFPSRRVGRRPTSMGRRCCCAIRSSLTSTSWSAPHRTSSAAAAAQSSARWASSPSPTASLHTFHRLIPRRKSGDFAGKTGHV